MNFKKNYLIYKETKYGICLYNKENRFFFWLSKKDVEIERFKKAKDLVGKVSQKGLDVEDEEFTAYLREVLNPMLYSKLPPRKPDFTTEKAYGWRVKVRAAHGRVEEVRIYFPKVMADLKRGVVKRDFFEETEFRILCNYSGQVNLDIR